MKFKLNRTLNCDYCNNYSKYIAMLHLYMIRYQNMYSYKYNIKHLKTVAHF